MEAWIVRPSDDPDDSCTLMHADTRGKAKVLMFIYVDGDPSEYTLARAKRLPELDDKPFTWENCNKAGINYYDENGAEEKPDDFQNWCPCDICKAEDQKRNP